MIKTAFYEKEITPPLGCAIPGYFNLRQGSDVKDRLYAKAVVVDNGSNIIAIAAADGCIVEAKIRDRVADRVFKYTKINPENIMLAYTHTHTGIPMSETSGDLDADDCAKGYIDVLVRLIADCITLAYYRLKESNITFGTGEVEGISFCRNYFMKNSTPRTNPGRLNPDIEKPVSGTDNDLPVLFFRDKDGVPIGAVTCFACHQDCVDGTQYSGDFSSELSKQLKKAYGEDFVSIFLAGTCGNINHFDVTREKDAPDHYRMMGRIIAGEALKTIAKSKPVIGDGVVSKYKIITMNRADIPEEKLKEAKNIVATIKEIKGIKLAADGTDPDQYNLAMAKKLLNFAEGPDKFDVPVQVIKIGDFTLYAFSNEVFYQYGKMVKDAKEGKYMVSSMCNASYGYVPTKDLFYDTIYESKIGSNRLEKDAGFKMAEALIEMGK
ncbi:MAG: neutral/alkaline non-lysosomal ceramidase N-terminal domain-containing protein [Bacillota bacterium]|nr:neutral/alkaline non-lysosomal ceramidase N-terminal domain-containing protein [Bacillota bacterium]